MSDDKKEPWLNYLALTTVILAVCATLSTFKGGGYSTKSVIAQAQASDQWAFYQAKSVKEGVNQLQLDKLQLEQANLPANAAPEVKANYQKAVDKAAAAVKKYDTEKADIQTKAKSLESDRDEAKKHGTPFGWAVILLQVAILMSSVAGLLKKKIVWQLALPVGAVGLLFFADGFWLFL